MIKTSIFALLLSTVLFFVHLFVFNAKINVVFVYTYLAVFSVLTQLTCTIVAKKDYNKTGFAFLGVVFVKLGLFALLFSGLLFKSIEITTAIRFFYIGIILIYLLLDVVVVMNILKKFDPNMSKNT